MKKDNIAVFIDGFNYYHAIKSHMREVLYTSNLKWLNYNELIKKIILKNKDYKDLKINFYTAKNTFKRDSKGKPHESLKHHDIYMKALDKLKINVIEGQFKLRDERLNCYLACTNCDTVKFVHKFQINADSKIHCLCGTEIDLNNLKAFKKVEEKKTDVKIAIDLVNTARDGKYNKIYLLSTDSDFIPAVEYIKENCPNVKIYIVAPADKIIIRKAKNGEIKTYSQFRYGVSEFEKLGITIIRLPLSKLRYCLLSDNFDGLINPWI